MFPLYGFNPYFYLPPFPHDLDVPPTLYAIMNSIANYGKLNKTKIKNLAKATHETIFDFDYPLSTHVSRETFETNILNHYMTRRIGYDTVTAFQIELSNRLNEIMPKYNILFDSMSGWNLFKDGLTIEKTGKVTDSEESASHGTSGSTTTDSKQSSNTGSNQMSSTDTASGSSSTANRHSDLPQSELQDIDDDKYVNVYEKNTNTSSSSATSTSSGSSTDSNTSSGTTQVSGTTSDTNETNKENNYNETIKQSQTDLATLYINYQNNVESIYTMIYKDLDVLFYGLV